MAPVCLSPSNPISGNILRSANSMFPENFGENRFHMNDIQKAVQRYIHLVNLTPNVKPTTMFFDDYSESENDIFHASERFFNPISHVMVQMYREFSGEKNSYSIHEDDEDKFTISLDDVPSEIAIKVDIKRSEKPYRDSGVPHVIRISPVGFQSESDLTNTVQLFAALKTELSHRIVGDYNITIAGYVNSNDDIVDKSYMLLPAAGFQAVSELANYTKIRQFQENMLVKNGTIYNAYPIFGYNESWKTQINNMADADSLVKAWEQDSRHVRKDDKTHIYYIDGVAPPQSSVSRINRETEHNIGDVIGNRFARIGTAVDVNSRYLMNKYFINNNGEWASDTDERLIEDFRNGKITVPVSFYHELQKFTSLLTAKLGKYGEDWNIISDIPSGDTTHYLYMDEIYTDENGVKQKRTRFGEMDFFVYTKDGRFIIIDMKTSNKDVKTLQSTYKSELNGYKSLFSSKYNIPRDNVEMWLLQFQYKDQINGVSIDVLENGKFAKLNDEYSEPLNPGDKNFQENFNLHISFVNGNSQLPLNEINFDEMQLGDMMIPIDDSDLGIEFVKPVISSENRIDMMHKNIIGDSAMIQTELFDRTKVSAVDRAFFAKSVGDIFSQFVRRLSTEKETYDDTMDELGIKKRIDFNDVKGDVKKTIRAFGSGFNKLSSGVSVIMKSIVRDCFFDPSDYDETLYPKEKEAIRVAYENFNVLIKLANPILVLTTGIYIKDVNYDGSLNVDSNVSEEQVETSVENMQSLENESSELGTKEMNFSLKVQNISAIQNMTAKMRSIFETLFEIDSDGTRKAHKKYFSLPLFLNSTATIDKILRLVSGSEDSEVMFEILHQWESDMPFIKTVLKRIENNPELRRNFWNAFSKTFNSMSVINSVVKDDGTVEHKVYPANETSTNMYFSDSRMMLYNHTSPGMILTTTVERNDITHKEVVYVVKNLNNIKENNQNSKALLDSIRGKLNSVGGHFSWMNKVYDSSSDTFNDDEVYKLAGEISTLSSYFGSPINTDLLNDEIKRSVRFRDYSNLSIIVDSLAKFVGMTKKELKDVLDIYKKIDKAIENIPTYMTNRESNASENGKNFYSYISDSYIERRIAKLTDSINRSFPQNAKISKSDDYIDSEFGRSYMLNAYDTTGYNKFRIPWLNWIYGSDSYKQTLKKIYIPMSDKTEFSEMSDLQYALTFFALYYNDRDLHLGRRTAKYSMPLYSNKGVYEAIRAYGYEHDWDAFLMKLNTFKDSEFLHDYKDAISDDFVLLARYEIDRMKTFLARKFEGANIDTMKTVDIKDFDGIDEIRERYLNGTMTIEDMRAIIQSGNNAIGFKTTPWLNAIFGINSRHINDYLEQNWDNDRGELNRNVKQELDRFDPIKLGSITGYGSYKSLLDDVGNMVLNELMRKNNESSNINFNRLDSLIFVLNKFGMENYAANEMKVYEKLGILNRLEKPGKNNEVIKGKYIYLDQYMPGFEAGEEYTDEYRDYGIETVNEFIWNDYLAKHNIILLTSGDASQYDGIQDFFKRNAQVHSPINKVDKKAIGTFYVNDGNGSGFRPVNVSKDGKMRYAVIKDEFAMSEYGSHLVAVAEAFFNSLDENTMSAEDKKKNIKAFSEIAKQYANGTNYTDSQAFNCPTSYAKKIQALGTEWTDRHQRAYEQIIQGNFNDNNADVLFEILKPFCFSNKWISSGLSGETRGFSEIPVSMQNKNSEYLILLFGSIASNWFYHMNDDQKLASLVSQPHMKEHALENEKLKAIHDFMEMSHYSGQVREDGDGKPIKMGSYNGMGIDTFEFVSASKVAPYGAIDLSNCNTYEETMEALKQWFYDGKEMLPENYNPTRVQTVDMDDWGKQTSMIEHLDNEKLEPSQERAIIPGSTLDSEDLEVDGEQMKAGDARREYEHDQALNIIESADIVAEEFGAIRKNGKLRDRYGVFTFDKKTLNGTISDVLTKSKQKTSQSDPEIIAGLELDQNGNPITPYGELGQSAKVEQMVNAVIRERINRQTKDGGSALQVATFGYQDDLSIVFTDGKGNRLLNLKEYAKREGVDPKDKNTLKSYGEYIKENNPRFQHYEVLMKCPVTHPLRSIGVFRRADNSLMSIPEMRQYIIEHPKTTPISLEDFEKSLEVIASRVPFESLYSCFPSKIKDWLPDTAGMAIVFPKEATLISGFDFDGDKAHYTMRTLSRHTDNNGVDRYSFEKYDDSVDENGNLKNPFLANRAHRNNRIFDLKLGFLRSQSATVRMLSPGSFDDQKKLKYIVGIAREGLINEKTGKKYTFDELNSMSLKDLRNEYNKIDFGHDIASATTQIYYHRINSSAQVDIGGTANNNTSHAMLTHANVRVIFGNADYEIKYYDKQGNEFMRELRLFGENLSAPEGIKLDPIFSRDGSYTARILANFLDAFVDTTKESVGEELNVNSATLGVMCTLARMGFTKEDISLFLTQPALVNVVERYFSGYSKKKSSTNVNYIVNDIYDEILHSLTTDSAQRKNKETEMWNIIGSDDGITTENMFDRINGNMGEYESKIFDLAILKMFKIISNKSKAVNTITKITQCNSVKNSPGPEYIDTFLLREQIETFLNEEMHEETRNFLNATQVFDNEIVKAFYENTIGSRSITDNICSQLFVESSPTIQHLMVVFSNMSKYVPSRDVMNYLVRDFVYYCGIMSGIFQSDYDTRNFFINEFSDDFRDRLNSVFRGEAISSESEVSAAWNIINNNDFVKKLIYDGKNSGRNNEISELKINFADENDVTVRQQIIASLEDLVTSDNRLVRAFGRNMLQYMLMKNGLNFSNLTTFTSLSTRTKIEMNDIFLNSSGDRYFDIFNPEFYGQFDYSFDQFLDLFMRNRSYLDGIMPTIWFNGYKKNYSHKFDDTGNYVVISANSIKNLRSFIVSKHSYSDESMQFIRYFKDQNDNLYRLVPGSFKKDSVVSTDGTKNNSIELTYEKVDKLNVKYHYIQYFSEQNVDQQNVLKNKQNVFNDNVKESKIGQHEEESQDNVRGSNFIGTWNASPTEQLEATATPEQVQQSNDALNQEHVCNSNFIQNIKEYKNK